MTTAAPRRVGAWILAAATVLAAHGAPLTDDVARHAPTGRFGTLPTPHTAPGMRNAVVDPADLGHHGYRVHPPGQESAGVLYTCNAGFLDLDHVRDAADWTAYLRQRFMEALLNDRGAVRFSGEDRDVSFLVRLRPLSPEDKARWAAPIAAELGRRYAFQLLTWHEVLTWFGYRKVFLFPEKVSAFSYEDSASHLVGVAAGGAALASAAPWDAAMDAALADELRGLGAVPRDATWAAFERVADRWYDSGSAWPSNRFVKKRDLDIGLEGRGVQPWQAPGVPGCEGAAVATLEIDRLATLDGGRFADMDAASFSPGPPGYWDKLFPQGRPLGEDGRPVEALDPRVHLAAVMAQVRREVRAELGPEADRP